MKRKLLFLATFVVSILSAHAVDWTNKTSLITNPSFENDAAISDLTKGNSSAQVAPTGWTITYDTGSNNQYTQQWGTANSSSKVKGVGSTHAASAGDKYFYLRENWHASTTYAIAQTIEAGDNLPAGIYILTVQMANYAPSGKTCTYKLSLQEEGETAKESSTTTISSTWRTWKVWVYKKSSSTKLTIKATMKASESNKDQDWCMILDDFQLTYGDYSSASNNNPLDVTALVTNPTFDSDNNGWTSYLNATHNYVINSRTTETTNFWQNWKPSNSGRMFQTISGLPSGTYKLTMMAFAQDKGTMTPANTDVAVYAKGNGDNIRRNYVNSTDFTYYDTYAYVDANGSLEIGLRADLNTFEWLGMDNVSLEYVSTSNTEEDLLLAKLQSKWTDVTDACNILNEAAYTNITGIERTNLSNALNSSINTIADYATNAATLQTAYLKFIAAQSNYDKYAEEKARAIDMGVAAGDIPALSSDDNYLTTLHELIVLEDAAVKTGYPKDATGVIDTWNFTSGKLENWTKQNVGTDNTDHWSGTTQTYYNTYDDGGFTMSLSKSVSLPAGSYVFKAAARCYKVNGNDDFYLGVTPSGSSLIKEIYTSTGGGEGLGIDKTGAANYTAADDTYAKDNKGYGWEWRFVKFTLDASTTVELKITANILGGGWVSFSDVTLLTTSANTDVFEQMYNTAKSSAESARDNSSYTNVKGVERQNLLDAIGENVTASIDAYSSQKTTLDDAISAYIAAKSNYDNLATAISNANTIVENSINVGDEAFKVPTSLKTTLSEAKGTAESIRDASTTTSAAAGTAVTNLTTAISDYYSGFTNATLNAPDETTPYNLYLADGGTNYAKNLTFKDGNSSSGTYAIGFTEGNNSPFNQAVHFKAVDGQKNQYYLYIIDAEGTPYYICTGAKYSGGNNDQIRVTTNESDALAVLVVVSNTENGAYNLKNTASSNKLIGTSDGGFYTTTKYNKFNFNDATKASVSVSIPANKTYATRIFPFKPDAIDGVDFYSCNALTNEGEDTYVSMVKVDAPIANTPYILKKTKSIEEAVDEELTGYGVAKENTYPAGYLTGVFANTVINEGYVLQTQEDLEKHENVQGFYVVSSDITVPPYRAYLTVPSTVKAIFFNDDFADQIDTINAINAKDAVFYNLSGQRVKNPSNGIFIVNGKKVFIK